MNNVEQNKCKCCGASTTNKIYCSMKCRDIMRNNSSHSIIKCQTCGVEFKIRNKCKTKYCSVLCANTAPGVGLAKYNSMLKTIAKLYDAKCPIDIPGAKEKQKKTLMERYGVDHPSKSKEIRKKTKKTNNERLGVDYPTQADSVKIKIKETCIHNHGGFTFQSDELKEKVNRTLLDKYGTTNIREVDAINDKIICTNNQRYGADYGLSSDEIKNKRKTTLKDKYNVENISQVKEIRNKISNSLIARQIEIIFTGNRLKGLIKPLFDIHEYNGSEEVYSFQCIKCDNIFQSKLHNGLLPRCLTCFPILPNNSSYSLAEKDIVAYIKTLIPSASIIENSKSIIPPYELDIHLPEYNLAIEYNGIYWHSELNGKDSAYHLNKTNMCNNIGIQLIHIYENEWIYYNEIVKDIINTRLTQQKNIIYARKCKVGLVDSKTKDIFLCNNHLQGKDVSSVRIGLFHEDELVSLMTFLKPRFNTHYQFELSRYVSKTHCTVIGGAAKMFNYFLNNYNPSSIITYSDKRYFNGNIYKQLGFSQLSDSSPNYWYISKGYLFHRMNFQKHKLPGIVENFDIKLTEWQNMQLNGYDRIWDCGNHRFEYIK